MSTLSEFEAIYRQLPPDIQSLINMIRAGTHQLRPKELRQILVAMLVAGGPRALIQRILILMTRLGWLAPEILTAAMAEVQAVIAAGATGGVTAGGAAAGGSATGTATGSSAAGGTAAGGGCAAVAITAATIAAIAVLVVELGSLINAYKALEAKSILAQKLDELNARIIQGIRSLRAKRTAGEITGDEFEEQINQLSAAFLDAQNIINAYNNDIQDELDDNFLIGIGEWFYGSTQGKQKNRSLAENPTHKVSMCTMELGEITEQFAALSNASIEELDKVQPVVLRYAADTFSRRKILEFFQQQWLEDEYSQAYRELCLRCARYFSTFADEPVLAFWQSVYHEKKSSVFQRKQAVLACYMSPFDAAWELAVEAAGKDKDPIVRVFGHEILGSIARINNDKAETFSHLATKAAHSKDNASRLGAVCGLSLSMHPSLGQSLLNAGTETLKHLVQNETNCYIAGTAMAALTTQVSECEIGAYLPSVVKSKGAAKKQPKQKGKK